MKFIRNPYFGILCSVLSSATFALSIVILKKVTHFDTLQQTLLGSIWMFVGGLPMVVYARKQVFVWPSHSVFTFLRVLLGTVAIYIYALASRYLPLAELAIISSATPGVASIAARIFLKEKCSMAQIISLLLAAAGALLAVRLPELLKDSKSQVRFSAEYVYGLISAVACLVTAALINTLIRTITDVHYSVQSVYIGLFSTLVSGCIVVTAGTELPSCGMDPPLMLSVGLAAFVGTCLKIVSLQSEAVSIVSVVMSCSDVVMALLFQVVFFRHFPDVYEWCGSAIVLVSVGVIAWGKRRKQRSE